MKRLLLIAAAVTALASPVKADDYHKLNVCMRWLDHHIVGDSGKPGVDALGRAQEDALAKIVRGFTHTKVNKAAMREFIESWCTMHSDESMVRAAEGYAAVLTGELTMDQVMR